MLITFIELLKYRFIDTLGISWDFLIEWYSDLNEIGVFSVLTLSLNFLIIGLLGFKLGKKGCLYIVIVFMLLCVISLLYICLSYYLNNSFVLGFYPWIKTGLLDAVWFFYLNNFFIYVTLVVTLISFFVYYCNFIFTNLLVINPLLIKIFFNCDMAQNCQINFNEPADAALLCRIVDIHNDFIYCLAIIIFFVISFWNFLLSFFGQKNDNFSNIDYKKIGDFFRGSSTLTYNEVLEIIWIVSPSIILLLMGIPFSILYYPFEDTPPKPVITIMVTNKESQWLYAYAFNHPLDADFKDVSEVGAGLNTWYGPSYVTPFASLKSEPVVILPMDIPLRIIVTSEDNIQTWSVPSLGISLDACPGQISTVDITIDPVSQGIHYGRSSEICDKGPSHRLFLLRILTPNLFYFYLPQQTIIEDIKDSGDDAGNSGLGGFLNFFKNIWQSSVSLLGHFFDKDRISKFWYDKISITKNFPLDKNKLYRDRVNRDYIRGLSIIKGSPKPVERKPWMCADYSRMMGPVYSSVDPTATKTDPTVTKTDPTAAKADSVSGLKWGYRGSTIREDEGALFELQDEDHPSTFTCHIDGEMAAEYIQGLDAITAAISDPIEWRRATQEFKKAFYNKHFSVDVVDRGDTPAPDSLLNAHTALRKFSEVSSNGTISWIEGGRRWDIRVPEEHRLRYNNELEIMLSDPTNGRLSVKEWEVLFNDFHQDFGFALVTGVFDAEDDDEDWG